MMKSGTVDVKKWFVVVFIYIHVCYLWYYYYSLLPSFFLLLPFSPSAECV